MKVRHGSSETCREEAGAGASLGVQRNRWGGALGMVLISRLRVVELPIQGYTAGQVE